MIPDKSSYETQQIEYRDDEPDLLTESDSQESEIDHPDEKIHTNQK